MNTTLMRMEHFNRRTTVLEKLSDTISAPDLIKHYHKNHPHESPSPRANLKKKFIQPLLLQVYFEPKKKSGLPQRKKEKRKNKERIKKE